MAARTRTYDITVPPGRAREALSFLAQLDDQSRRLLEDLRGITAAELQWQPKRGANTIGMLLAHIAIVEVFWLQVATGRVSDAPLRKQLGIGVDDDGMPMAAGAAPPASLRGRTLSFYTKLLARSRAFGKRTARNWTSADLGRIVSRTRLNGDVSRHSLRWILYHLLEHEAGHYGQILLLRHLYRDRRRT